MLQITKLITNLGKASSIIIITFIILSLILMIKQKSDTDFDQKYVQSHHRILIRKLEFYWILSTYFSSMDFPSMRFD